MGRNRVVLESLESRRMFAAQLADMAGPVEMSGNPHHCPHLSVEALRTLMPVLDGTVTRANGKFAPAMGPIGPGETVVEQSIIDQPVIPAAAPATFADATNQFGADLYATLRAADPNGNVLFSPYSLEEALAMVYAGSAGVTRQQMSEVLHLPADEQALLAQVAADHSISGDIPSASLQVDTADKLWIDQSFPVNPDYLSALQSAFDAPAEQADFVTDSDGVKDEINAWVSEQTHGKIPSIFDSFKPDTVMALANAVYFNAKWMMPFDSGDTHNQTFNGDDGTSESTLFMHQTSSFEYYDNSQLQMIDMPYQGGQYSMVVVLPKSGGLASIDSELTGTNLTTWLGAASPTDVQLALPKFTLNTSYSLPDTLAQMGMPDALERGADFSGISSRPTHIDQVNHKAFINVSEEGTEAAAVTGISVVIDAVFVPPSPPVSFVADHPFYYAIRNNQTGAIIFSGAMMNPNTAN